MAEIPAIMVGLDFADSVKALPDADAGQLFKAALQYGVDGSDDAELSPMAALLWMVMKKTLARNQMKYIETCQNNSLAVRYREYKKQSGNDALPFKTWKMQILSEDANCSSDDVTRHRAITGDDDEISPVIQYNTNSSSNNNSTEFNPNSNSSVKNNPVQAAEPPTDGHTPTRTEIEQIYFEKGYGFDLERFIAYNERKGWKRPLAEAMEAWNARERPTKSPAPEPIPAKQTFTREEYERTKALLNRMQAEHGPDEGFTPPTVEQVAEYVRERGSNVDPQGFIDFYASKGWMVGKSKMKDWKAACRNAENWERWNKAPCRSRNVSAAEAEAANEKMFDELKTAGWLDSVAPVTSEKPPTFEEVKTFIASEELALDVGDFFNWGSSYGWRFDDWRGEARKQAKGGKYYGKGFQRKTLRGGHDQSDH